MEIICLETEHGLLALRDLLGKYCLFGFHEATPSISSSMVLKAHHECNMVVGQPEKELPFIKGMGRLGMGFLFDGNALRLSVQYQQVMGNNILLDNI